MKGGEEEKEDLNNQDSIEDNKKEGEMAKKRCKTGYKRSGKKCVRKKPKKRKPKSLRDYLLGR